MDGSMLVTGGGLSSVAISLLWAGWHVRGVKAAIEELRKELADHNGALKDLYNRKVDKGDCDRLRAREGHK